MEFSFSFEIERKAFNENVPAKRAEFFVLGLS